MISKNDIIYSQKISIELGSSKINHIHPVLAIPVANIATAINN